MQQEEALAAAAGGSSGRSLMRRTVDTASIAADAMRGGAELPVDELYEEEGGGEEVAPASTAANDDCDHFLPEPRFTDHFSLKNPSCSVRFRGSNVRVYDQWSSQILLESQPPAAADTCARKWGGSGGERVGKGQAGGGVDTDREITVKRASGSSFRLRALRAVYTVVCLFFAGFLFLFCFQILLFLFMGLLNASGATSSTESTTPAIFIGTLLSVPVFIYGLSACMVLAASFVCHTWDGYTFLRSISNADVATVEWVTFIGLLGIPLMTMAVTLFTGTDQWWVITSLTWLCCTLVHFLVYGCVVVYYEVSSALALVHMLDPSFGSITSRWSLLKRAVLLNKISHLGGVKKSVFIVRGDIRAPEGGSYALSGQFVPTEERMSYYSRLTTTRCCLARGRLFTKIDPPKRVYTIDEARGVTTFVTRSTWSLDKMFSTYMHKRVITVVSGPSALLPKQMQSSLACVIIGSVIAILLIAGFLVWFEVGAVVTGVVMVIVILCCCAPNIKTAWRMFGLYREIADLEPVINLEPLHPVTKPIAGVGADIGTKLEPIGRKVAKLDPIYLHGQTSGASDAGEDQSINKHSAGDDREDEPNEDIEKCSDNLNGSQSACGKANTADMSEGLYRIWEKLRVTRPSDGFCWASVTFDGVFLFLWPLVTLFVIQNFPIAIFYFVIGLFTALRYYLNAALVLEELGSFDMFEETRSIRMKERDAGKVFSEERWKAKARLNAVVSDVSRGRSNKVWLVIFLVIVVVLLFLSVSALATQGDDASTDLTGDGVLQDFHYEPTKDMRYPSCHIRKGLHLPEGNSEALIDYAFIAKLAFASTATTQPALDAWFGPGVATDEQDTVDAFRSSHDGVISGASYKLVTFVENKEMAIVTIRGSITSYDWLTDIQLWSAAFLAQVLRGLLPVGEMWNPILSQLVKITSLLETKQLQRVSYYKETAAFVRELQKKYANVQVTGHSLGGGIALITGAQTGVPAIGLSAPNSMISRLTYDPPVTEEQLNTQVFNIVPNRDIVAHIDDVANLFQRIECRGPKNKLFACHSSLRSICEIGYNCGSGTRPISCKCATELGYPPPIPSGNRTFAEACKL